MTGEPRVDDDVGDRMRTEIGTGYWVHGGDLLARWRSTRSRRASLAPAHHAKFDQAQLWRKIPAQTHTAENNNLVDEHRSKLCTD